MASLIDLWYVTQTTKTITPADLAPVRAALESSPRVELQLIDAAVADAYTAIPRSVLKDPWDRFIVATASADTCRPPAAWDHLTVGGLSEGQ